MHIFLCGVHKFLCKQGGGKNGVIPWTSYKKFLGFQKTRDANPPLLKQGIRKSSDFFFMCQWDNFMMAFGVGPR